MQEGSEPVMPQKLVRRYKVCMGVSLCFAVGCLAMAIVLPFFLTWVISSQAAEQVPMAPNNEFLWSHIPGITETYIHRNFTFFNFTNPKEVIYLGHKPVFNEIGGYHYYQKQDYDNLEYVDDGKEARFNFRIHFDEVSDSRNTSELVTFLNFVPMGLWYQVKSANYSTFNQQGMGLVTFTLRDTFKSIVQAQGVSKLFVNQTSYLKLSATADIEPQKVGVLWGDPLYGMSDPNHFTVWVAAALNRKSGDYKILKSYFDLTSIEIGIILDQIEEWAVLLDKVIDNWYCPNGQTCDNDQLTFAQFSQSAITAHPPPGVDPSDSFCSQNVTCSGYPQLSSYLKYVFPMQYPQKKQLTSLTFTTEAMRRWLLPSKQPYCLLHIGNIQFLWEHGQAFDSTGNRTLLEQIQQRFKLDSFDHAFVFWSWLKSFTKEFLFKESRGGTRQTLAIGGGGGNGVYTAFAAAQDWMDAYLLAAKLSAKLSLYGSCGAFMNETVGPLAQSQLEALCESVDFNNYDNVSALATVCDFEYGEDWSLWKKRGNLSDLQMAQLCDRNHPSLGRLTVDSRRQIFEYYGCSMMKVAKRCTPFELAMFQWNNSLITLNPIPELAHLPTSLTVTAWNSSLKEYEYNYFLGFVKSNSTFRPVPDKLVQLLSFDFLFSGTRVQEMMLQKDDAKFEQIYYWKQQKPLKSYIKYMLIEVSFNGYTMRRSVQELLFGFEDPLLKQLRDTDPAQGGDPSLSIVVGINEHNTTQQEAKLYPQSVHTGIGKDQLNRTRAYKTANGKSTINLNYSYYSGNEIINATKSPWTQDIPLDGTDGSRSYPGLVPDADANNISIYIPAVYRIGQARYNTTIQMYGLDVLDTRIDPKTFECSENQPSNAKYFMGLQGFINITTLSFAPFFVSKNHFLDCPKNWSELVDIYDESGQHKMQSSYYDDSYLQIEPISGITFSARIYLQTSYLYEQDELFEQNGTKMIPMFTLYRCANVSETVINDYFYLIKLALAVKKYSTYAGIVLSGLFLMVSIAIYLKLRHASKQVGAAPLLESSDRIDRNLMISLQPQSRPAASEAASEAPLPVQDTNIAGTDRSEAETN